MTAAMAFLAIPLLVRMRSQLDGEPTTASIHKRPGAWLPPVGSQPAGTWFVDAPLTAAALFSLNGSESLGKVSGKVPTPAPAMVMPTALPRLRLNRPFSAPVQMTGRDPPSTVAKAELACHRAKAPGSIDRSAQASACPNSPTMSKVRIANL